MLTSGHFSFLIAGIIIGGGLGLGAARYFRKRHEDQFEALAQRIKELSKAAEQKLRQ